MVAPKHVLENVSALDMVSLVQVYEVVSSRSNFFSRLLTIYVFRFRRI